MQLTIRRERHVPGGVLGRLEVDGVFLCYTAEGTEPGPVFVPDETALPVGLYNVSIVRSARFRRDLPLVAATRHGGERRTLRLGMLIHPGHPPDDCGGQILLGEAQGDDTVTRTRPAFEALWRKLEAVRGRDAIECEILWRSPE